MIDAQNRLRDLQIVSFPYLKNKQERTKVFNELKKESQKFIKKEVNLLSYKDVLNNLIGKIKGG